MKRNRESSLGRLSDWIFFLMLVCYQVIFIFQGLDFADEGFYATFYQQIFRNPESVVFNFMHWLSGIIGGTLLYIWPESGLLGIRILGIIVVTSTIGVVYNALKKYVSINHLRLSILLLLLFISNDPKEIYYDNLSALLSAISAVLLFKGLKDDKSINISASGAFISLNMFARTPGIVEVIFSVAILYYGYINKWKFVQIIKKLLFFVIGFLAMSAFILLIMRSINHLSLYFDSLRLMFGMGVSDSDTHNLFKLIKLFIRDYSISIAVGLLLIFIVFIVYSVRNSILKMANQNFKFIITVFTVLLILVFVYLTISDNISWSVIQWIFNGLSLIVSSIILADKDQHKEIKLLVFLGCMFLLFAPVGSAGGMLMMGRYSLWIIFPITIDFLFNIKSIDNKLQLSSDKKGMQFTLLIKDDQMIKVKRYFVLSFTFICLYYSYYFPYFDKGNRLKMHYPVENKLVKGIYTTKERADVINELLSESGKYVKKNDYVLAYDCIPMYYYLTETVPFMRNSWPWIYFPEAFNNELSWAINKSNKLPVVIEQKINTLDSDWPINSLSYFQKSKPDFVRDSIFNEFIIANKYEMVWENKAFKILLPGEK